MTAKIPKMNTFILSNMAPQYDTHNSYWEKWETYVQAKAEDLAGVIFVITGVTKHGHIHQIKKYFLHVKSQYLYPSIYSEITIPEHWYKLLVWCENGNMEAEYIFSDHVDINNVSVTYMHVHV